MSIQMGRTIIGSKYNTMIKQGEKYYFDLFELLRDKTQESDIYFSIQSSPLMKFLTFISLFNKVSLTFLPGDSI